MTEKELERYNALLEEIEKLDIKDYENPGVQVSKESYRALVDAYNELVKSSFDKELKMRGFIPSEFSDYNTYQKHHRALERAQGVSDQLLKVWDDLTGFTHRNPGMYWELQRFLHDATQVGYEAGIGKLHCSIDYDITPQTLSERIKCQFCTHQYLVYGCEPECSRLKAGLPCELEVREFLE